MKILVRKQKFLEKNYLTILLGRHRSLFASWWDNPDFQSTFLKIEEKSDILKLFHGVPQLNVQISLDLFFLRKLEKRDNLIQKFK